MVEIIQTVNYLESEEHVREVYKLFTEVGVNGIRVNLCKYQISELSKIIQVYISYFAEKGIKKIYLDVPYPIDKARIFNLSQQKLEIKKGEIVKIICCDNDNIKTRGNYNNILVRCTKVRDNQNIIYYGDGEGAFKVQEYRDDEIICVAQNDFYIINGKSLSCGFYSSNQDFFDRVIRYLGEMKVSLLIPFVEDTNDIKMIREMIGENISLISKIESTKGIDNIIEIANCSDAVMIGRGDLVLYTDLKELLPRLMDSLYGIRDKRVIFCTGILQNLRGNYLPECAEIFDLLLIKQLYADEVVLSGSMYLNADYIKEMYEKNYWAIKRKMELIEYVW